MRQIVLDTETTGINPKLGNRIIEIGCVELHNRMLTGNNFHVYINPERESEEGALNVHGLTTEFLRDKPKFHEIVEQLREYIQGAGVIIRNAPFDLGFLNHEFRLLKLPDFSTHIGGVIDTLVHAKDSTRASATRSTRCATAMACRTRTASCTARCSMPSCWPMSTCR